MPRTIAGELAEYIAAMRSTGVLDYDAALERLLITAFLTGANTAAIVFNDSGAEAPVAQLLEQVMKQPQARAV